MSTHATSVKGLNSLRWKFKAKVKVSNWIKCNKICAWPGLLVLMLIMLVIVILCCSTQILIKNTGNKICGCFTTEQAEIWPLLCFVCVLFETLFYTLNPKWWNKVFHWIILIYNLSVFLVCCLQYGSIKYLTWFSCLRISFLLDKQFMLLPTDIVCLFFVFFYFETA